MSRNLQPQVPGILSNLIERWRREAELFHRRGMPEAATMAESYADELEVNLRNAAQATVKLADAARISGYTADHIGRLIREGDLENIGRKNAPRVRIMDLPRKPGCLTSDHDIPVLLHAQHGGARGLEENHGGRRLRVQSGGDAP